MRGCTDVEVHAAFRYSEPHRLDYTEISLRSDGMILLTEGQSAPFVLDRDQAKFLADAIPAMIAFAEQVEHLREENADEAM